MGVFIYLNVSNKVTPEQWEKAYEETLTLVEKFDLVEYDEIKKFDRKIFCLIHSKEREIDGRLGWLTIGDGTFLRTAEDHFLPRRIPKSDPTKEYADPLMYVLAQHGIVSFDSPSINNLHEYFGSKTQGEPYHMALLAIGCLLDDRLNGEAICSGDITYGQCEHAITVANKYLNKPIKTPLRCDLNRLFERVSKLPIENEKRILAFEATYLGPKNKEYFDFIEQRFDESAKRAFIREKLKGNRLGTYGFSRSIRDILAYPIPVSVVCEEFVAMNPESLLGNDKTGNPYEMFLNHILETNIHVQKKDLRNCLDVDEASGETMCVEKQFASVLLMRARNKNVDRFVPLEDLKQQLESVIGTKCDVEKIVEEYLKKNTSTDPDNSTLLNDVHDKFNAAQKAEEEKYDIADFDHLPFYEKGDSIRPKLQEQIKEWIEFYKTATKEEYYAKISKKKFEEMFRYFALQNQSLHLMKDTWEKILKDIETHPENFERYYPMVRVSISSDAVQDLVRAYVENDDFYEFCQTL